jgi:hypothetical protein
MGLLGRIQNIQIPFLPMTFVDHAGSYPGDCYGHIAAPAKPAATDGRRLQNGRPPVLDQNLQVRKHSVNP